MELHSYQRTAVRHLHDNPRAGLFLDMGLGKTASTLCALTEDHLPALVVAPKRVAEHVWRDEAALWRPDLELVVAAGRPDARRASLASGADIVALGRDNLRDALSVPSPWRTVVIDELSGFKTRNSVRWKTAAQLLWGSQRSARATPQVPHVWGLTGTPSPNGLGDLWAQLWLLDRGQRLGSTLTEFRSRFMTPGRQLANGVITEWLLRPGAAEKIHELVSDICMSLDAQDILHLPPTTRNRIDVTLPSSAMTAYRRMKDDLVADLTMIDGEVHTAQNAAVLTNKLSQISAGFLYVDDADLRSGAYTPLHREKLRALEEIVDGTGSPILVFYRYRVERDLIASTFPQAVDIDAPGALERWNQGKVPLLLAHPASAGHGLNLQHGGHTIVWTSLPWSLEEWEQANKRLARQGQRHPVVIHLLMARKTVDGAILERLTTKADVQTALLRHLETRL